MASRMKKMFHRKKDDDLEEPQPRARAPTKAASNPAMRTSLYDSTTAGHMPQSGDYPIKGNDSSTVLQNGRKSSIRSLRSRRSSSRGSQPNNPSQSPIPNSYDGSRDPYRDPDRAIEDDRRNKSSRAPLAHEFAGLSLGDQQSPTTVTQTVTTTQTPHQGPYTSRTTTQNRVADSPDNRANVKLPTRKPAAQDSYPTTGGPQADIYGHRNNIGANSNPSNYQQPSFSRPTQNAVPDGPGGPRSMPQRRQGEYDTGPARQKPMPRKEVGTSAPMSYSSSPPSNYIKDQPSHSRQQSASKALPATPVSPTLNHDNRAVDTAPQPSSVLDRSRPITRGSAQPREAQDVVNRAKSNTYDTEVIEKIAPAVVHETVNKDVHHIREEVITREIHTHDTYHRILPIVDVEVLPPRHFLPVEGGGLVEVSASEVPGRGQHWVIAETASKIPSDQGVPKGLRKFTAREFPGREGDAVRYTGPEGQEVTEQTWVHWPELEQGARLTGQSWPMVFDDDERSARKDAVGGGGEEAAMSMAAKRKSPKKGGPAVQASSAQRAGGLGRSM